MTVADPIFGPLVYGGTIQRALKETLRTWLPTYLHWVENQTDRDRGSLQPVAWWQMRGAPDFQGDEPLPYVEIIVRGTPEDMRHAERGRVHAVWEALLLAYVGTGGEQEETHDVAMLYALAIRKTLLKHRTLGGVVVATRHLRESYDDLSPDEDRTLGVAGVRCLIDVDDVDNDRGRPAEPDPPTGEPPSRPAPEPLDTPAITVTSEPLTEELT